MEAQPRKPTAAQREVLRWLAEHPGQTVQDCYSAKGAPSWGTPDMERRTAANAMARRLTDAGWLEDGAVTYRGRMAARTRTSALLPAEPAPAYA